MLVSVCPSLPPYDLHAQSPCKDQFRDFYDHHSSHPHGVYSYCQSFDLDVNYCPCYDGFDDAYARFNTMIVIMNEQHEHFVSQLTEFCLLHETNPSQPFLRLEVSLYDD